MKTYINYYRLVLFIGLFSFSTLSSCVGTRQGMDSQDPSSDPTISVKSSQEMDDRGRGPFGRAGNTELHMLAEGGFLENVKAFFLKNQHSVDVNVNAQNIDGDTALHLAVRRRQEKVIEYLADMRNEKNVQLRVDLNIKNNHGNTPLHLAVGGDYGHYEDGEGLWPSVRIVDILLALKGSNGVDVNAKNKDENTPLQVAIGNVVRIKTGGIETWEWNTVYQQKFLGYYITVIKRLIKEGAANVNIIDKDGDMLLNLVYRHNMTPGKSVYGISVDILSDFLKSVDVNASDNAGNTPLHLAAEYDDGETIKHFAQVAGIDLNAKNNNGDTPLHIAVKKKHISAVAALVKYPGINVNVRDNAGNTPLHLVAEYNYVEFIEHLFKAGIDLNAKNNSGKTPLHIAVEKRHMWVVEALLKGKGINVNASDKAGSTPLHLAVHQGGESSFVYALLGANGIDVNAKDKDGSTALHLAAAKGDEKFVKVLLGAKGINVNIRDKAGDTALHLAAKGDGGGVEDTVSNLIEIVRRLLEVPGIDLNARNNDEGKNQTALHLASHHGHEVRVKMLLSAKGIDVNAQDSIGNTPLHLAMYASKTNVVWAFMDEKNKQAVNFNIQNNSHDTPLMVAIKRHFNDIAEEIIKTRKVDFSLVGGDKCSVLQLAAKHNRTNVVKCILQLQNVNVDAASLREAAKQGDVDIVEALIQLFQAANTLGLINEADSDWNTPLYLAAKHNHLGVAVALLKHLSVINVNAQNNVGDTALHIAAYWDHIDIVKALVQVRDIDLTVIGNNNKTPLQVAGKESYTVIEEAIRKS